MMRSLITVLTVALFTISALAAMAHAGERASISLGTDPEPPAYVENPGGQLDVHWSVEYSTTPEKVIFFILGPDRDVELHREEFPGLEGIEQERDWTVVEQLNNGDYWTRVEYWSEEIGLEAYAEVAFLLDQTPAALDDGTWGKIKSLFEN